ncbi:MAG: hypothetical protein ACOC2H_09785, partial [Spirochaetota bacterium]
FKEKKMKKLISFLIVMLVAVTFFAACEDDENTAAEGSVAFDIFRDGQYGVLYVDDDFHFSNSLYNTVQYSKSPYNGISSMDWEAEYETSDGTTYERGTMEYNGDGFMTSSEIEESSDGTSWTTLRENSYEVDGSTFTGTGSYSGGVTVYDYEYSGKLNSNAVVTEKTTTSETTYGDGTTTSEYTHTYTFDGWDLTTFEESYANDASAYLEKTFTFDSILPSEKVTKNNAGDVTRRVVYKKEGGDVTEIEVLDGGNNILVEYTLAYTDNDVTEIIKDDKDSETTDEKYEITWSAGLIDDVVFSYGNAETDNWTLEHTTDVMYSAGRLAEVVRKDADGSKETTTYTYSE